MTIDTMTLKELVEKGADGDLLREMIAFLSNRLMELGSKGARVRPTASARRPARTSATAIASAPGTRASAPST